MGSEMCIRDRPESVKSKLTIIPVGTIEEVLINALTEEVKPLITCLLYTSDAADERSSVDLGGRRIIKKKNI